jgi:hypothetical protein
MGLTQNTVFIIGIILFSNNKSSHALRQPAPRIPAIAVQLMDPLQCLFPCPSRLSYHVSVEILFLLKERYHENFQVVDRDLDAHLWGIGKKLLESKGCVVPCVSPWHWGPPVCCVTCPHGADSRGGRYGGWKSNHPIFRLQFRYVPT